MSHWLKRWISNYRLLKRLEQLEGQIENLAVGHGQVAAWVLRDADFRQSEFKVFSQFGEDGLIQHLIRRLDIPVKVFVEFGVETYAEANTRFLLIKDNWSGLVIDGNERSMNALRKTALFWRQDLKAISAFITRDNINPLIAQAGIAGEIGLLSIDIDGNDYWVWEAITQVSPVVVIVEYNHRFGPDASVTIPYDAAFNRKAAHHSMIYFGASLAALNHLAARKGYAFVGCNSAGNNAFFVRRDRLTGGVREVTVQEGFVAGKFRESRNRDGELVFLSADEERAILATLPVQKID